MQQNKKPSKFAWTQDHISKSSRLRDILWSWSPISREGSFELAPGPTLQDILKAKQRSRPSSSYNTPLVRSPAQHLPQWPEGDADDAMEPVFHTPSSGMSKAGTPRPGDSLQLRLPVKWHVENEDLIEGDESPADSYAADSEDSSSDDTDGDQDAGENKPHAWQYPADAETSSGQNLALSMSTMNPSPMSVPTFVTGMSGVFAKLAGAGSRRGSSAGHGSGSDPLDVLFAVTPVSKGSPFTFGDFSTSPLAKPTQQAQTQSAYDSKLSVTNMLLDKLRCAGDDAAKVSSKARLEVSVDDTAAACRVLAPGSHARFLQPSQAQTRAERTHRRSASASIENVRTTERGRRMPVFHTPLPTPGASSSSMDASALSDTDAAREGAAGAGVAGPGPRASRQLTESQQRLRAQAAERAARRHEKRERAMQRIASAQAQARAAIV